MSKKDKLQKILKALTPDSTSVDFKIFDDQIATLKEQLKEKITVKTIEDLNVQLEKFRRRIDLQPLLDTIKRIEQTFATRSDELVNQLASKSDELELAISGSDSALTETADRLKQEISSLETQQSIFEATRASDIINLKADIDSIRLADEKLNKSVKDLANTLALIPPHVPYDKKEVKELRDALEKLRKELLNRINNLGGGQAAPRIQINGTTMSTRYADINFKGTLSAADNNTTKQVDITIPDSAASIGGIITGGTTGSVLFINPTGTLAQDNANFFWDDANNRLGIGVGTNPLGRFTLQADTGGTGFNFNGRNNAGADEGFLQFFKFNGTTLQGFVEGISGRLDLGGGNGLASMSLINSRVGVNEINPLAPLAVTADSGGSALNINGRNNVAGESFIQFFKLDGTTPQGYFEAISGRIDFLDAGFNLVMSMTAKNLFIGGGTVPTARLHLSAGTATATTAPLKFNTGTLLTVAEAGAVEFLTDSYYATTTTGAVRRMIVAGNTGRSVGAVAAVASVATYTLGATDASFEVSMNVLVTTATLHNFTCECAYTDEGNTARVITFSFSTLAGAFLNAIINTAGAVPYEGVPLHIRCKASTAITLRTQAAGTYTTVVFSVEGIIKQIA